MLDIHHQLEPKSRMSFPSRPYIVRGIVFRSRDKFWGFHGRNCSYFGLLVCDTMQSLRMIPTFERISCFQVLKGRCPYRFSHSAGPLPYPVPWNSMTAFLALRSLYSGAKYSTNILPVLSSERAPHSDRTATALTETRIWSWVPDGAWHQDGLTDRPPPVTWLWRTYTYFNPEDVGIMFLPPTRLTVSQPKKLQS
jgi:hypothetical protein